MEPNSEGHGAKQDSARAAGAPFSSFRSWTILVALAVARARR